MSWSLVKRILDLIITVVIIVLIFPFIIVITFLIYIKNKETGVFFTQVRVGKNSEEFRIIKFKTMTDAKDSKGDLLQDKHRMTKIGAFIRASSIDELPQLINVIKGDMSLVGPRPLLPKYLPLYNKRQARRHEVKPGITGWAQVNGRNSVLWEKKFEMDVWYIENQSFLLDIKILLFTLQKVFKREGISSTDSVSGFPFTGNK